MAAETPTWPRALALGASILGLAFAGSSALDSIAHLDRQVHDLHCGFIPGVAAASGADGACRAAMYSPYAALLRDRFWGGVPISLFAVGAFAFFTAFSLYLVLAGSSAPRRAALFLGTIGTTPLVVSLVMFTISIVRLGQLCKTCSGIYVASALLAIAGFAAWSHDRRAAAVAAIVASPRDGGVSPTVVDDGGPAAPRTGGPLLIPAWLLALGIFTVTPALLYVRSLPSYATYVASCGKLEKPTEPNGALLHVSIPRATQPATMVVDPLCPTCKAFHQRLVGERIFEQLDTTFVLFPLDSDCNWMLDHPVHPGSCLVSKAVLCGEHRALAVLEWSFENQERILAGARAGAGLPNVRAMLRERWPELDACLDAKDTNLRLNRMLRWAVTNHLPVSTPQMFLGDTRVCDEDTDIGLSYALHQLAPGLERR